MEKKNLTLGVILSVLTLISLRGLMFSLEQARYRTFNSLTLNLIIFILLLTFSLFIFLNNKKVKIPLLIFLGLFIIYKVSLYARSLGTPLAQPFSIFLLSFFTSVFGILLIISFILTFFVFTKKSEDKLEKIDKPNFIIWSFVALVIAIIINRIFLLQSHRFSGGWLNPWLSLNISAIIPLLICIAGVFVSIKIIKKLKNKNFRWVAITGLVSTILSILYFIRYLYLIYQL